MDNTEDYNLDIEQLIEIAKAKLFVPTLHHAVSDLLMWDQRASRSRLRLLSVTTFQSTLVVQCWIVGQNGLEVCGLEQYLVVRKLRHKHRLEFALRVEKDLVYLTWLYKLQGFSRGGYGGTDAFEWKENQWQEVSVPGCEMWRS